MTRTIKLKTVFPYTQDTVWRALTEPKLLGSWFMENNIEPTKGHYFTFRMKPQKGWDGITHCEIIDVKPKEHIAYTYRGEATGEKALACAGIHSDTADKPFPHFENYFLNLPYPSEKEEIFNRSYINITQLHYKTNFYLLLFVFKIFLKK